MDDIHLEDPRKFSAKQIKVTVEKAKKHRTFWQYMFDLIVKTFILASVISIDFTLFANSGNYSLFSSSWLNIEAQYIYIAIFAVSFVLMFIVSFFRSLENVLLAIIVALTSVALINQFATFEKQSALLVLFQGIFSENINVILYEYSFLLVGVLVFLISWFFLNLLKRQFLFYLMLCLVALQGWLLSEAYLGGSSKYFRTVASAPSIRSDKPGKNLVFLSFNDLTSTNNLKKMYESSKQHINIQSAFNNALGFYSKNGFILYPNALVKDVKNPFMNLISAYNSNSDNDVTAHISSSTVKNDYFDFTALQQDKIFMKNNSLYDVLKKDGYSVNVYQSRGVDTCYVNGKIAVNSCKEKVNMPISLDNQFSVIQKTLLLTAQWLNSTGMVTSINPVLKMLEYVYINPALVPFGFEINELYGINSFKVFDQIIDNIDRQNGNNAYFAVVDIPSDTYIYDEFCQLKNIENWQSEKMLNFVKNPVDKRRSAYADQVSCLYGYLEKFVQQLDKLGYLENTTIVIEGLNNPLGLNKNERDFYRKMQENNQVALAIRPAGSEKSKLDYSVCYIKDILSSYFFKQKACEEFKGIKTTEKVMKEVRNSIEQDKYKKHEIETARNSFSKWFDAWKAHNQFGLQKKENPIAKLNMSSNAPKKIEKVEVAPAVIAEEPEQKMKSISAVDDETLNPVENIQAAEEEIIENIEPLKVEVKENEVNDIVADVEDITDNEVKPVSDIELKAEEVIPEAILDDIEDINNEIEDAISAAKQKIKEKQQKLEQQINDVVVKEENIKDNYKDDNLRKVLEAPVVESNNLSPEELKKQYRKALKEAADKGEDIMNIEVKVIEN